MLYRGGRLKDFSKYIAYHDTDSQNQGVEPCAYNLLEHTLFYPDQAQQIGAKGDKERGGEGKCLYDRRSEIGDHIGIVTQKGKYP